MDWRDWQRWIDAIQDYVAGAAAGIGLGAVIIMLAPASITMAFGLRNPGPAATKIAPIAAAVWAVCRLVRWVRRK